MVRMITKAVLAGAVGVCALLCAQVEHVRAQDKDEKKLTTKQIMGAGHKGADALFGKVQAAVKAKKWEDAAEPAKELAANGSIFPKAKPPKGDDESWKKLAGKYADDTKALAEAVDKKDEAAAKKAMTGIGNCKTCHDAHKGK